MIENMLLYLRATRQQLWEVHLAAKDQFTLLQVFTKYYFARMSPVYLSAMYIHVQSPDWGYRELGVFERKLRCVNKSEKSFVTDQQRA